MASVIVAFSKAEDGKNIKNILMKRGFHVTAVCTSGAQALMAAESADSGVVVCGSHFPDMMYEELYECLPRYFDMLVVGSPDRLNGGRMSGNMVCLTMPLKVHDLISTMEMILQSQVRRKRRRSQDVPRERNTAQQRIVDQAKKLLMDRNNMSESEAYRYIQKCSMNSGVSMAETAQMVVSLIQV